MSSTWNLLKDQLAPLLVHYEFGSQNYSVWLTDLTDIWEETLNRREIVKRALTTDTSIDPSEDKSQMQSFLSNIQKALEQQPDTLLSAIISDSSSSRESLELRLNIPLPGSLAPLQWCMYLSKSPPSSILNKIWVPVLVDRMTAAVEKTSLVQHLKEKDQIITKLLDQMQADGSDLSKVFPGTAVSKPSSRGNVRQAVGKSIKGMAIFDEALWQNRMLGNTSKASNLESLMSEISPLVISDSSHAWDLSGNATSGPAFSQSKLPEKATSKSHIAPDFPHEETNLAAKVEVGGFQRQPSPSKSVKPTKGPRSPVIEVTHRTPDPKDGDSTTDVSDEDLTSSQTVGPESRVIKPSQSLSHVSKTISPKSPPSSRNLSPNADRMDLDEPDAVGQDTDEATKPKRKLGKIGGQKGAKHSGIVSEKSLNHTNNTSKPSGEASADNPEQEHSSKVSDARLTPRGRPNVAQKGPASPRETSEERANKNRERLKRELDSKPNAATKKRRKF